MGRPSISAKVSTGKIGKEQRRRRIEIEEALRGEHNNVKPPKHLTPKQKRIFKQYKELLEKLDLLSNADVYILTQTSIAIDRIENIDAIINNNPGELYNKQLTKARKQYAEEYHICLRELCLNAKTKLIPAKKEDDILLKILRGEQN